MAEAGTNESVQWSASHYLVRKKQFAAISTIISHETFELVLQYKSNRSKNAYIEYYFMSGHRIPTTLKAIVFI